VADRPRPIRRSRRGLGGCRLARDLKPVPLHFRMSALPPKADITESRRHVRLVPSADG
jgi:hypothetical protein